MSILSNTNTGKLVFFTPKTKGELKQMIWKEINEKGNNCSLNHINVSKITDMSFLFSAIRYFNGDISNWNISNVENMDFMFYHSIFDGDISKWNVSNVTRMSCMFCRSEFNKDISNWQLNPECNTDYMFGLSKIKEEYKPKKL